MSEQYENCRGCPAEGGCVIQISEMEKECPCSQCLVRPMCKYDCNNLKELERIAFNSLELSWSNQSKR